MAASDQQSLFALANFIICATSAWACLARISMMSAQTTRKSTRFTYAAAFACATGGAFLPLWGLSPDAGELIIGAALAMILAGSAGAWSSGTPPHAMRRSDEAPKVVSAGARHQSWSLVVIGVLTMLLVAPIADGMIRGPITRDWTVTRWHIEGNDVIVSGVLTKWWSCEWEPPNRATDENGASYIVFSTSPDDGKTRPATRLPAQFGPWRILGAAGRRLQFYAEHRCHPYWPVITVLGTLDTSKP